MKKVQRRKIYTHVNIDLDAVMSTWLVKLIIPHFKTAKIIFVPSNWNGNELSDIDIAVDIEAGGKGYKGEKGENGKVYSAFSLLLEKYGNDEDKKYLRRLATYIDLQDSTGNGVRELLQGSDIAYNERRTLEDISLNNIFRSFQYNCNNDKKTYLFMKKILDSLYEKRKTIYLAKEEAKNVEIFLDCIAIQRNSKYKESRSFIWKNKKVKIIIYVNGNNIGVLKRNNIDIDYNDKKIKQLITYYDEEDEWFLHSNGFLFCRGSNTSPCETPSRISEYALAKIIYNLINK